MMIGLRFSALIAGAAIVLGATPGATQGAGEERLLALESRVPLGDVRGRIDHLAVDLSRKRLFVAELGNDSVGIVDLAAGRLLRRITGMAEPQGVGYVPSVDALYAANARDGSVRVFSGDDYAPSGRIDLASDADNIRVDPATNTVFVGYGDGAIAAIDPMTRKNISDTRLPAHPEGFQVASTKVFVNVPERRAIVTIDRASGQPAASWPTKDATANFPMALDDTNQHVIVVFRKPARLAVFAMTTGERLAERDTCGDSDDVFIDAKRARLYVSCGDGRIDVFDAQAPYQRRGRIATVPGARTSLFMPGLDRLAVAVRATAAGPAAIWIYRPEPE